MISVVFFGHGNHFFGVIGRISVCFDREQAVFRGHYMVRHASYCLFIWDNSIASTGNTPTVDALVMVGRILGLLVVWVYLGAVILSRVI